MNWTGALLSVALVAGVIVWGYQLLMRDVTGVPVVRALEGPMRITPEDPGGARAAYQGLAVNQIAATGGSGDLADRVVLAPPTPELTDEDQPMAALLPDSPEEALPDVSAAPVSPVELAIAEALGESPLVTLASASAEDVPQAAPALIPADVAGVARSLIPRPRPEGVARRVAALDTSVMVEVAAGVDADQSAIAPGTRLVQLGAYPTEDEARAEWDRISVRFEDFMDGKSRVVQEAEAGGKTFFRLRVLGFEDLSDSRRFCAVLVAGDASCIPVAWR